MKFVQSLTLVWVHLLVFSAQCLGQTGLQFQGIAYTSYTKGDYPSTTSWIPQAWFDSQGILAAVVSSETSYQGEGSLAVDFTLVAQDPHISKGELYVDLRFKPPLFEPPLCPRAPFDLAQQIVSLKVWVTPEMYNPDPSHPNGLQIFFKSIDDSGNWWSFYGSWHNVTASDIGQWKTVVAVPSSTAPPGGFKDPLFDPRKIVSVGVKFGTGSGSAFTGSGRFWIDHLDWPDGVEPEYGFENLESAPPALARTHANFASVLVTWYMDTPTSDEIHPDPDKTHSDEEVIALIETLHDLGLGVLLKPHVDVLDDTWRGMIQPVDVGRWFGNYTEFITRYAQMAEDHGVSLFAVGTELESLSGNAFFGYWQSVIAEIAAIYHGELAYAANWDGFTQAKHLARSGRLEAVKSIDLSAVGAGFKAVSFWALVDYIGIDAYFPLSDEADPSLEAIIAGWTSYDTHDWVREIESFADTVGMPVIFTEIGYPSRDFATQDPWDPGDPSMGDVENAALQARAYEAAYRVFQDKPWFRGLFWWNWMPWSDAGGRCDLAFTAQNKPAEEVLRVFNADEIFRDGFESGDASAWS